MSLPSCRNENPLECWAFHSIFLKWESTILLNNEIGTNLQSLDRVRCSICRQRIQIHAVNNLSLAYHISKISKFNPETEDGSNLCQLHKTDPHTVCISFYCVVCFSCRYKNRVIPDELYPDRSKDSLRPSTVVDISVWLTKVFKTWNW